MTEGAALALAAFAAGGLLAAQGPILTQVARHAGGPIQAAIVAFAVGLAALVALALATGGGLPDAGRVLRMPRWLWACGLIGTALLVLTLHAVPRIGVAAFVGAVVCGQLVAALALDHFGALGLPTRALGWRDALGAALLIGGLLLILDEAA